MAQSFKEGCDLTRLTSLATYEVARRPSMTALVPPFARFPYEVWIVPKSFRPSPAELTADEVGDCARLLATVVKKYDAFFGRICPYVMIVYVAPRGMADYFPFHIQFYPLLRAPQKLKYLAGCELGAGSFLADILPETAAQSLRDVKMEDIS
jgi:UDPglucose--hexose-1-phosphate uridylyltransferase